MLEKTLESPLDCKITPINPKGNRPWVFIGARCWRSQSSITLATWCKEPTHWKRPWCWERLRLEEEDNRGWDGWMALPTQWTWVWASSGSWWRTGKPGAAVHGMAKSWTWLGNWTWTIIIIVNICLCVCVCVSVYIHINILTHRIKQLSDQLTQAPNKPGWRGTARPSAEQVFGAFLHSWGGAAPAHPPTSLRSRLPLPAKMFCPNRHGPQSVSLTHLWISTHIFASWESRRECVQKYDVWQ